MKTKNIIYAYCLVAVVMILGTASLRYNLAPLFDKVDAQISAGETIVMNSEMNQDSLTNMLLKGNYISTTEEAEFISEWLKKKLTEKGNIINLGALNSDDFKIPAEIITEKMIPGFIERVNTELLQMGQDKDWKTIQTSNLSSVFGTSSDSTASITAKVENAKNVDAPIKGIVVRITRHWINDSIKSVNNPGTHEQQIIGYALTDESGTVTFNVPIGYSYSVIPIASGFQYGQEKGTSGSVLSEDLSTKVFTQKPHALTPFRGGVYSNLKQDKAVIVRTPSEFKDSLMGSLIGFLICWAIVFIATGAIDRKQGRHSDYMILIVLMILNGISILILYGQMLPLTDMLNAAKMVQYTAMGCGLLILFSLVDYRRFYQWYRSKFSSAIGFGKGTLVSIAAGYPFLILSLLLMVLVAVIGSAPEGSNARVNINLGVFNFQPSEVIKYLMVVFMAFFFISKGDVIKTFGEKNTRLARKRQWSIVGIIVFFIAVVCLIYLGILEDMGPGIVILATFILLYSIVRRDFPQLIWGILSYICIVGASYMLTNNAGIHIVAAAIWFIGWIVINIYIKKQVFESAIFFNFIITMILMGGYLIQPFHEGMAQKLFNRTNMTWSGIFDNAVSQGDQIAQGLWGTASGGLSGMGLGGGSSYFIPAGHTDLILCTLGEQLGWIGILLIAICFYILIYRTVAAAKYSGHRFTLLIALGFGLLTAVQMLFIALGAVGAIPLSGVAVPFLSYSGTSLIMALAMYGVVMSISRHPGSAEALRSYVVNDRRMVETAEGKEARSLSKNLQSGLTLFFIGTALAVGINGYYQLFAASKTMIRPAITSRANGQLVLGYNPRIAQVINRLDRGNIYDRNGVLLATSSKAEMESLKLVSDSLGIERSALADMTAKRLKRYYPFGASTVFMVGDINRPDVYSNFGAVPMGYFAEAEHADLLKGYDTKPLTRELTSKKFRVSRFATPVENVVFRFKEHDYSDLLPALQAPIYRNSWIDNFNAKRKKRDLYLALDARLQQTMQANMVQTIKESGILKNLRDLRASVIVLDAGSGELLTSANYPLPNTDSIISIRSLGLDKKNGAPSEWSKGKPITERDLGTTYMTAPGSTAKVMTALSGFSKLGSDAYNQGFIIKPYMTVEPPTREPNTSMPSMNRGGGNTTFMENAIKFSSNCYFVMLLNEKDLYQSLGNIYKNVGASLGGRHSYFFSPNEMTSSSLKVFDSKLKSFQTHGLKDYDTYINRAPLSQSWNSKSRRDRMSSIQTYTGIAWGQSQLEASPLTMARVASLVGNDGKLAPTQYIKGNSPAEVEIIDSKSASMLASAMREEASKWTTRGIIPKKYEGRIGGKTGTPMRTLRGKEITNDGWYICFIKDESNKRTLAVAVRLERLPHGVVSTEAVKFVGSTVIPTLEECGYLK